MNVIHSNNYDFQEWMNVIHSNICDFRVLQDFLFFHIFNLNNNCSKQSLVDPVVTSSNLIIPILFDKNQAQGDMGLCKFQAQRVFTWGGVLEYNIIIFWSLTYKLELLGEMVP